VREGAIHAAWRALQDGSIDWLGFRAWLAMFEMVERRLATPADRTPDYAIAELTGLLRSTDTSGVRAASRALVRAGLVRKQGHQLTLLGGRRGLPCTGRWVPLPRRLVRHLVRARGRAYVAAAIGHILRCLYYRRGECVSGGYAKASWIAETFEVAERAVKQARGDLVAQGWLTVLDADQTRLNRFGAPVVVNLHSLPTAESAPGPVADEAESAPPDKHKKLSLRRSDHPQPAAGASDTSGLGKARTKRPTFRDVQPADLDDPSRTIALFVQAERMGLVNRCEADKLNFLAAAEHAKRVATRSVGGLFVTIVRKRFYKVISHDDEDAGRRIMQRIREQQFRIDRTPSFVTGLLNRLTRQGPSAAVPPPSIGGWEAMPRSAACGEGSPAPR
jgi:hypothetical protein